MFEQVFFSGLALGSIYGLVALGFAVIFKATDVFNFAQGMFVVCGAYFAVTAMSILQLPFPLAILFIVGAAALLGVLIHPCCRSSCSRLLYRLRCARSSR